MGLTPLVLVLTGLLFMTTAWSYSEATAMLPEAGGSSSFARRAFNEFVSFGAGWGLMLDYIITMAISAFFVPTYLAAFWPVLKIWPWSSIGGVIVVLALVAINVIGIREAVRLNIVLAALDLATQVLLMLVGLILLFKPAILINSIHWGVAPTWRQLIYGISIGTVAYTGIETISNMAEEAANPGKDVPRAVNFVLAAVLVVYAGMSLTALAAMPVKANLVPVDPRRMDWTLPVAVEQADAKNIPNLYHVAGHPEQPVSVSVRDPGAARTVIPAQRRTGPIEYVGGKPFTKLWGSQVSNVFLEDPLQGIVHAVPQSLSWLRAVLKPWIGILAATILVIGTNAGIIGVSRLAYSMGQHRQIPPALGRVHPKRLTPYVSIIVFGVVACLLIAPGDPKLLADLYAFGAMIAFTTAHISVVALRIKEPDLARPWRTPLNFRWRGKLLPLTAVIGGLGTFTVWCVVVATHYWGRIIGLSWMAVGLLTYVVYRRAKGYSLTATVRRIALPESTAVDIDYDQILVPIIDSRLANEMMVLACQLAREKESSLDALYVIEVPMNLPLNARLVKERAKGQAVLERAVAIAAQFKVKVNPILVTARQAGRAIVETARERRSEVIVIGSSRKRRIADRRFGRTVDYVLDNAPTEVLHNLVSADYPMVDTPLTVATPEHEDGATTEEEGSPT
jgi:APA family basic amino acid/polyamine antiporter